METTAQTKLRQNTALLRLIQIAIESGHAGDLPEGSISDALDVVIDREMEIYELLESVHRLNRLNLEK
jgi:hypothetical protein